MLSSIEGEGEVAAEPRLGRWSAAEIAAASILAAFAFLTNLSTVLNNAYALGTNVYDAGVFETIIWRSGWALMPAPVVDDVSFLNVHTSVINYLPSLFSYVFPFDRMLFAGLVYAAVYAALVWVAYALFRRLFDGRVWSTALATAAFYLSGLVMSGQWEPHQEIASALFTALFFLAWSTERRAVALIALVANAAVREDCGLLLTLPLALLAISEWLAARRGMPAAKRDTLAYAILSAALSVLAFGVQKIFFTARDSIGTFYFGPDLLSHLTADAMVSRLSFVALHSQYLWLPAIALIVAAIVLRDARVAFGWVAFVPYVLFNFVSKLDMNAELAGYKGFPLILALLWPAVIAISDPDKSRRGLRRAQAAVLFAGLISVVNWTPHLDGPEGIERRLNRWLPHPEIANAEIYRDLEAHLDPNELGPTVASDGVLSLYPYSFPIWFKSSIGTVNADDAPKFDSFFWFVGDRQKGLISAWLDAGHFPYFYRVIGTRIRLATRKPIEGLKSIGPLLVSNKDL